MATLYMEMSAKCVDCGREFKTFSIPMEGDILCTPCLHARRRYAEAATRFFDPSRVDELTKAQAISLYAALVKEWPELLVGRGVLNEEQTQR